MLLLPRLANEASVHECPYCQAIFLSVRCVLLNTISFVHIKFRILQILKRKKKTQREVSIPLPDWQVLYDFGALSFQHNFLLFLRLMGLSES